MKTEHYTLEKKADANTLAENVSLQFHQLVF